MRQILRLLGPAIIGTAAVQINVFINTNFASAIIDPATGAIANGPVSWLNYAFRFMQFPIGVFGVAIATATLPTLSRNSSQPDYREFRQTLAHSLTLVFLLCIPSALGLAVLGRPIIALIFEHGKFTSFDTVQTANALAAYSVGLAGYAAIKVLSPAFYALHDARTPMLISLGSILVNFVLNSLLVGQLRPRGSGLFNFHRRVGQLYPAGALDAAPPGRHGRTTSRFSHITHFRRGIADGRLRVDHQ